MGHLRGNRHGKEPVQIATILKLYTVLQLAEGHRYGYELLKELARMTGKKVSPAQVYPFLKELQASGHIRVESKGERERTVYQLTAKGQEMSASITTRLSHMLDSGIKSRLVQCAHCGCQIYQGAHRERIRGRLLSFCCAACAAAFRKA
ncbi:MAG: PadR family transcriptional regulator [Candidatus Aenigmarchaeota archaeon]|nr:PadR family transcriptional regulator [Candidatus Aenigmarchaeota archaeon]